MKAALIVALAGIATAGVVTPEQAPECILANCSSGYKIPSSYESAVMGRRILAKTKLGTLSTIFPASAAPREHRPAGMEGVPIGLMDYVADCESDGNPTILAINIATSFKNLASGSNMSLAMRWMPPYPPAKRIAASAGAAGGSAEPDPVSYSAANLPRFSLFGFVEDIPSPYPETLTSCFVAHHHPDAKYWTPGNPIHSSRWVRLVVTHIYWIGGFGDRAFIGWIPEKEWKAVSRDEWEGIRLPGESEGWQEWNVAEYLDGWMGGEL